jgi:hypothetical protein
MQSDDRVNVTDIAANNVHGRQFVFDGLQVADSAQ